MPETRTRRDFLKATLLLGLGLVAGGVGGVVSETSKRNPETAKSEVDLNVGESLHHKYDVKDNEGGQMDRLRMLQAGDKLLGVYHTYRGKTESGSDLFDISLGSAQVASPTEWVKVRKLFDHGSMAEIYQLKDGSILTAHENTVPEGNSLIFSYFPDLQSLIDGKSQSIQVPRSFGNPNEGTPTIKNVTKEGGQLKVGVTYHFYDGHRDLNAGGSLMIDLEKNSARWDENSVFQNLNDLLTEQGIKGGIGDRCFLNIRGKEYMLIEAQRTLGDWGSFEVFLVNIETGTLIPFKVNTDQKSKSIANPGIVTLTKNGQQSLLFSFYVHGLGAANGEAGSLLVEFSLSVME